MISAFESCLPHCKITQLLEEKVGNTYGWFFNTMELVESADFWALPQGFLFFFFFNFIYLFLEIGEGREKRERKSLIGCLWHALKGGATVQGWQTWPSTQACALTRNRTGVLLGLGMIRNPLSHTGQGRAFHSSSLWWGSKNLHCRDYIHLKGFIFNV